MQPRARPLGSIFVARVGILNPSNLDETRFYHLDTSLGERKRVKIQFSIKQWRWRSKVAARGGGRDEA